MQGINLARRPFVNRRPVLRLAILLWVIGIALTIWNVNQFGGHWKGTSVNRQRLIDVDREIRAERKKLAELDQALAKVQLSHENRRTAFLNQLISYRTFPWSALFDDLEEVVPADVMLLSVKPSVKLKTEPRKVRRRQLGRPRPAAAPAETPAAAPADAGDDDPASAGDAEASRGAEERPLRRDEVRLKLAGIAKSEDALVEFIEVLYASPFFHSPFLPGESFEANRAVKFSLSLVYLTHERMATAVEESTEVEVVAAPGTVADAAGAESTALVAAPPGSTEATEATEATGSAESAEAPVPTAAPGAARRSGGVSTAEASRADDTHDSAEGGPGNEPVATRRQQPRELPGSRQAPARSERALPESTGPGPEPAVPGRLLPGSRSRPPEPVRLPSGSRSRSAAPPVRFLPGSRPGSAVPQQARPGSRPASTPRGSGSSGATGSSGAQAPSRPPPPTRPDFAEPAASATPQLGTGARLVVPSPELETGITITAWEAEA